MAPAGRGQARGVIRRSQAITTFGVGALIDLPDDSAIVGGIDAWPDERADEVTEPRLAAKLQRIVGGPPPRLIAPPAAPDAPWETGRSVPAYRFPTWFVERQADVSGAGQQAERRSRRLVHRKALDDRLRLEGQRVVATRFVRACPKGHVDDVDWRGFVHRSGGPCQNHLRLHEGGVTGDLSELVVRCGCGAKRNFAEAKGDGTLGPCSGLRPWLGEDSRESCDEDARLLIRTATNAWFPQILSVLTLPDRGSELDRIIGALWDDLQVVDDGGDLAVMKKKPAVTAALTPYDDHAVLQAIRARKATQSAAAERPLKQVELDALLDAPEGFGDDIPVDPDFHARRLPERIWRRSGAFNELVERVVQVHRLREVMALAGFTRFEAVTRGIDGEYASDVERAVLAHDEDWFPAVENRGEGIFVQVAASALRPWLAHPAVADRVGLLATGQAQWNQRRRKPRDFPGGPYVLLHTLAHLLTHAVSTRCGYPAASIRERIYADEPGDRYGVLLYTASADAEGTLGGLVEQAGRIEEHLETALETAALCSNDPVCAHHDPGVSMEERWLHGAACHGCTLLAETSCEMSNDYLDRALVTPVIGCADAAFFPR